MRRGKVALFAVWVLAVASVSAAAAQDRSGAKGAFQMGVHGSTLGWGVSAGYDFSDSFSLRGLFSHLDYDSDLAKSGNRFYGELELLSVGMVLDYHPFGGGFRMTGGAFINGNELIGRARGARMDIGGEAYAGHLDLKVDFDSLAPYLGVGYSGGRGRTGLSLVFDAGVLFQGSPNLSISGNFDQCGFTVDTRGRATLAGSGCASLGSLKADIEEEHRDLTDGLADLKLYPVALLGLSYRF